MKLIVDLHIVLEKPPPGIDFGLQKGSGSKFETVQTKRSAQQDLHFDLIVEIKGNRQKDGFPAFGGAFVQGTVGNKFIYLDIGAFAGQTIHWNRRLKIPLSGITWNMIDQVNANPALMLTTRVAGTGKDGGPNCATVKPFDGWKLIKKNE